MTYKSHNLYKNERYFYMRFLFCSKWWCFLQYDLAVSNPISLSATSPSMPALHPRIPGQKNCIFTDVFGWAIHFLASNGLRDIAFKRNFLLYIEPLLYSTFTWYITTSIRPKLCVVNYLEYSCSLESPNTNRLHPTWLFVVSAFSFSSSFFLYSVKGTFPVKLAKSL